jgi:hypothetical protein
VTYFCAFWSSINVYFSYHFFPSFLSPSLNHSGFVSSFHDFRGESWQNYFAILSRFLYTYIHSATSQLPWVNLSIQADDRSAGLEIRPPFREPGGSLPCSQAPTPLVSIYGQMNPVHNFTSHSFNNHSYILASGPIFSTYWLPLIFPTKTLSWLLISVTRTKFLAHLIVLYLLTLKNFHSTAGI